MPGGDTGPSEPIEIFAGAGELDACLMSDNPRDPLMIAKVVISIRIILRYVMLELLQVAKVRSEVHRGGSNNRPYGNVLICCLIG